MRARHHRRDTTRRAYRAVPCEWRAEETSAGDLIIKGFASVFNVRDSYNDVMLPGCYAESIAEDMARDEMRRRIKTLWHHNVREPIGRPILLEERDRGLYVEAKLVKDDPVALQTYGRIRDGVVNQQSVGFNYTSGGLKYDEDWGDSEAGDGLGGAWLVGKVDLWEHSPVTWGANRETDAHLAHALDPSHADPDLDLATLVYLRHQPDLPGEVRGAYDVLIAHAAGAVAAPQVDQLKRAYDAIGRALKRDTAKADPSGGEPPPVWVDPALAERLADAVQATKAATQPLIEAQQARTASVVSDLAQAVRGLLSP